MLIVYLLRHAQSVANTKGILAGQDDTVALSKLGQKQAQTLVPYLKNIKFEKVLCSPLKRCVQTISPYMSTNPKISFEVEPRIIEMDYGLWSGRKLSTLSRNPQWKGVQNKPSTFTFPQGESFKQMRKRVESVIAELSKEEGSFLLVTHGDIIKMFIATALDLPIDRFQSFISEPASITSISLGKKRNTILQINYKLTASDLTGFKVNQLGGGNLLTNAPRWWRK